MIGPINMIHTCDVLTYDKRLLCKTHLRSTCEYGRFNRSNAACDKMNLSLTHKYDEHMIKRTSEEVRVMEHTWRNTCLMISGSTQ